MEVIVRMTKVNPWTGLIKWSNCFDYLGSYWTRSGSRYTGLTKEDQKELEEALGMQEGSLGPDASYWDTFAIKIGKKDLIINTDRPEGKLQYLYEPSRPSPLVALYHYKTPATGTSTTPLPRVPFCHNRPKILFCSSVI